MHTFIALYSYDLDLNSVMTEFGSDLHKAKSSVLKQTATTAQRFLDARCKVSLADNDQKDH